MKKLKNDINIIKPVIKWVGGKTQIINTLLDKFPKQINNYHEIFVGGSSVLMGLLCMIKQKEIILKGKIYAYDIN
jgi:DNA adenine methylase